MRVEVTRGAARRSSDITQELVASRDKLGLLFALSLPRGLSRVRQICVFVVLHGGTPKTSNLTVAKSLALLPGRSDEWVRPL